MDSKFAFNKLLFVEMDRKNILLHRSQSASSTEMHQNQVNSHFLSHFLAKGGPLKTKGSVSKCLFGRPEAGETKRLEQQMFHQERIRALNLYQFDVATQQPVNLTPPASPYIGHTQLNSVSDRLQFPIDTKGQEQKESGSVDSVSRSALERVSRDGTVIEKDTTCEAMSVEKTEEKEGSLWINRRKRRSSEMTQEDAEEQSSRPVEDSTNGKDHITLPQLK